MSVQLLKNGSVSNHNLLINGDFQVWQRGESISIGSDKWYYTADRFRCKGSGTVSKVSNGLKASASTNIQYIMEDIDFNKINGKTVTLSYSKNGSVTTSTFTCSSAIVFNITLSANDVLNWVKLELGSIATPLISRSYGEELALCQRYFVSYLDTSTTRAFIPGYSSAYVTIDLTTTMRTTPTIKFVSPFKWRKADSTLKETSISSVSVANNGFKNNSICLSVNGIFDAQPYYSIATAIDNKFEFDAEIYD